MSRGGLIHVVLEQWFMGLDFKPECTAPKKVLFVKIALRNGDPIVLFVFILEQKTRIVFMQLHMLFPNFKYRKFAAYFIL